HDRPAGHARRLPRPRLRVLRRALQRGVRRCRRPGRVRGARRRLVARALHPPGARLSRRRGTDVAPWCPRPRWSRRSAPTGGALTLQGRGCERAHVDRSPRTSHDIAVRTAETAAAGASGREVPMTLNETASPDGTTPSTTVLSDVVDPSQVATGGAVLLLDTATQEVVDANRVAARLAGDLGIPSSFGSW